MTVWYIAVSNVAQYSNVSNTAQYATYQIQLDAYRRGDMTIEVVPPPYEDEVIFTNAIIRVFLPPFYPQMAVMSFLKFQSNSATSYLYSVCSTPDGKVSPFVGK